jgi:ubiquitin-conjugating enzyme E2 N
MRNLSDRRLCFEVSRALKNPPPGISIQVDPENIHLVKAAIQGPESTPFAGGIFRFEIFFPSDYPMFPPKVRCLTRIFHPNFDKLGRICIGIPEEDWMPMIHLECLLVSIQARIGAPCLDDTIDASICQVWLTDREEAIKIAQQWTAMFAH